MDKASAQDEAEVLVPALAKVKANLELFLGKSVLVSSAASTTMPAASVPGRLPERGLVLGVQASGTVEGQLHCVVDQPLLLAMTGIAQLKPAESISERIEKATELDSAERDGAIEVGSFITAALGDFAKDSTGGRIVLAPLEPRFIPGDAPPDFGGVASWVVIEARVEVAPAPASVIVLVVPSPVVAAWKVPEAPSPFGRKPSGAAAADAGGVAAASAQRSAIPASDTPSVWIAARAVLVQAIQQAAGDSLVIQGLPSLAQVIAAAESAAVAPAVVLIEVSRGFEHQLEMISALRHDPVLCGAILMVALESPSRRNVVRCGALGILEVVPSDLDPSTIADRIACRARAHAARAR
jgi:hypothetical protein